MTMILSGSGTIAGLVAGGLPDATITQPDLAGNVAGNGPAFSAYGDFGNQTIANTTLTKVIFNTKNFDTNSNYDTTNYRFLPTIAGYYQINTTLNLQATGLAAVMICSLFKNGTEYRRSDNRTGSTMNQINASLNETIYFNGSTDYIEVYAYISGAGTLNILSNGGQNRYYSSFSGFLARSA